MSENLSTRVGGRKESDAMEEPKDGRVTLRKACCLCVRLKRACDGKDPCHLCIRRRERCTRSIKRKSGPAKGTKYTTRRQRLEAGIIDPIVPPKGRGNKRATTRSTIPAAAARAAVRAGAGAAVGIAVDSPAANSGGPSRKTTDARGQHGTSTPATVVAPSTPPRLSSSDHLASPLVTGAAFGRAKAEQAVANMKSGSGGAGGRIATGRNAARPAAVVALGSGRGGGRGNGRGGRGVRGRGRPSRGGRGRGASTSSVVSGADTAARFASCGGGGNGGDAQFVDGNAPHALSAPQVVRGRSESRGGGSSGSGPIGASKSTRVVARRPMSLLCLPVLPWPSPSLPSAMPAAPPPGGGLGNTGDEEFHQVGRGRSTSPFGLLPPPPTLAGNKPRRGGTREPPVEAAGGQGHFWAAPGAPSSKRYRMSPPFPSRELLLGGVSGGQRGDDYSNLGMPFMGSNIDYRNNHNDILGSSDGIVISPDGYRLPTRGSGELPRPAADPNQLPPGVWPFFSSSGSVLAHPFPPAPGAGYSGSSFASGSQSQAIPFGTGWDGRGGSGHSDNDGDHASAASYGGMQESYHHRQQQVHQDWGYPGAVRVVPPPLTSLAGRSLSLTGGAAAAADEDDPLLSRLPGTVEHDHDHTPTPSTRWRQGGGGGGSEGSEDHEDESASEAGQWRSSGAGQQLQLQHQAGGDTMVRRNPSMGGDKDGVSSRAPGGSWGGGSNSDILPSSIPLPSSRSSHSSDVVGHHHNRGVGGGGGAHNVNDSRGAGWEEFDANASLPARHDNLDGAGGIGNGSGAGGVSGMGVGVGRIDAPLVDDGLIAPGGSSSMVGATSDGLGGGGGWASDHLAALASSPPSSPAASSKLHGLQESMSKPLLPLPQHLHHQMPHYPQQSRLQRAHGMSPSSPMINGFKVPSRTRGAGRSHILASETSAAPTTNAELVALGVGAGVNGPLDRFRTSMAVSSCPLDDAITASKNYSTEGDTSSFVWTTPGHVENSIVSDVPPSLRSHSPSEAYFPNSAASGHDGETGGWGVTSSGRGRGGGVGREGSSFMENDVAGADTPTISRVREPPHLKRAVDSVERGGGGASVWQPSWDGGGGGEHGGQRASGSSVGFERESSAWPEEFSI